MTEEVLDAEIVESVKPFDVTALDNAPTTQAPSGLLTTDQARAVAEVQAAMVVAKSAPRDEEAAYLKIMKACRRKSLALQAHYAYRRGGTLVEGPSIRLAEVLLRCWGNSTAGFRELSRGQGVSEVEAFAWDLESNAKFVRQFQVRHRRDREGGSVELKSERDIYEYVAGMAQRRVRSCICELIPGDIVDAASEECKKTLERDEKPLEERVRKMLVAFGELGVTKDMIENYLQHQVTAIVPQQFYQLIKIYNSIKDGVATREEFFKVGVTVKAPEPKQAPNAPPEPEEPKQPPSSSGKPDVGSQGAPPPKNENEEDAQRIIDAFKYIKKQESILEWEEVHRKQIPTWPAEAQKRFAKKFSDIMHRPYVTWLKEQAQERESPPDPEPPPWVEEKSSPEPAQDAEQAKMFPAEPQNEPQKAPQQENGTQFVFCYREEQRVPKQRCEACPDKDLCAQRESYLEQIDVYVAELGLPTVNRILATKFNIKYATGAKPQQWEPILKALSSELDMRDAK